MFSVSFIERDIFHVCNSGYTFNGLKKMTTMKGYLCLLGEETDHFTSESYLSVEKNYIETPLINTI